MSDEILKLECLKICLELNCPILTIQAEAEKLYNWIKNDTPTLYREIKKKVA